MKKYIIGILIIILCIVSVLVVYFKTQYKNQNNDLLGTWIADGTQYQLIKEIVDGKPIYISDDNPYYLDIKSDNTYLLNFNNDYTEAEIGTYEVDQNKIFFFPKDTMKTMWSCKINNETKLQDCEIHASSFEKS